MYTINLILYSYFAIFLSILFFYCIGDIILKYILKISLPVSAQRIFTSSFIGIFISVLCYSIIQTSGNTSSLLFIPLIGFYFFFVKRKQSAQPVNVVAVPKSSIYTFLGYNAVISLLLYLLFCYSNLDSLYHFRPMEGDNYAYGMLSQYLNRGYENLACSKNFWFDSSHHPYHYFEIWLNAILYKIFHLNSTWTYSMILPTVLHTIIFWGLMSIIERYKKINLLTSGICFILLFTTEIAIILSRFEHSPFPYPNQYCSGLILTKVAPISLFFLAVILLLINKKNKEALLVALSMPIVSLVMTPVVFAVTGYLIIKDLINSKGVVKREYFIPYVVTLCLFAVYILLREQGEQNGMSYNKFPSVSEMHLRLFITNPISFGMRYIFPIVLILLIDFKRFFKFCKRYGVEIFLFFTMSTAFNVALRPVMADATQFTSLAYYGIFNILFPSLILYYWRNNCMYYIKIALLFVFITGYLLNITTVISFCSNNRYLSATNRLKYEEIAAENIQTGKICIGVVRSNKEISVWGNFINSAKLNYTVDHNYIVSFLDAYKNDIIYYSIVIGGDGFSKETAFAASFNEAQSNNPLLTQDDFRINFIKQTGINYILVYPGGVIPDNLSDKLQLISKDTDSGECFYKVTGM